jgi:hypothetical protein
MKIFSPAITCCKYLILLMLSEVINEISRPTPEV